MPWRLHLTNRAIQRLDVVPDKQQPLLAVWTQPGRVAYFDLQAGAALGERRFTDLASRQNDSWQGFLEELKAPNDAYLPVIPADGLTIYLNQDGRQRLNHLASGEVRLVAAGRDALLSSDSHVLVVGFDRTQGTVALLDSSGRLRIRQKDGDIASHEISLPTLDLDRYLGIAVAAAGDTCYVAYDRLLLNVDSSGKVRRRLELHYPIGAFAASPDGRLILCSDRDTNVVRVYDPDFAPLYQRHAVDLMARATQVQLIADPPPSMISLNVLTAADDGILAFALAGVICVTDVSQMMALPRPAAESDREP